MKTTVIRLGLSKFLKNLLFL